MFVRMLYGVFYFMFVREVGNSFEVMECFVIVWDYFLFSFRISMCSYDLFLGYNELEFFWYFWFLVGLYVICVGFEVFFVCLFLKLVVVNVGKIVEFIVNWKFCD